MRISGRLPVRARQAQRLDVVRAHLRSKLHRRAHAQAALLALPRAQLVCLAAAQVPAVLDAPRYADDGAADEHHSEGRDHGSPSPVSNQPADTPMALAMRRSVGPLGIVSPRSIT